MTPHEIIEKACHDLFWSGLAGPSEVAGCSDSELETMGSHADCKLPLIYQIFLQRLGAGAGRFLVGTDWTRGKLIEIQRAARRLVEQLKVSETLPQDAFIFAMHQGYEFLFFRCNEDEDPPVYLFTEGEDQPKRVFSRFSEWLTQAIKDEASQ